MATAEFDPQPLQAYAALEKTGSGQLLDAIDDAIDALENDPGDAAVRRRSFGDGLRDSPRPRPQPGLADHLGTRPGRRRPDRHPLPRNRPIRLTGRHQPPPPPPPGQRMKRPAIDRHG